MLLAASVAGPVARAAVRIVGGSAIGIQAAPWTVYIQDQTAAGSFFCTGSILDRSHIVTAAHCLYTGSGRLARPGQLRVLAGVSNVSRPRPGDGEQARTVTGFAVHPGYAWATRIGPDDVAVLTVSPPLRLGGTAVAAIPLRAAGLAFPTGVAVWLAGFGEQTPGTTESGQLESMRASVDPQGSCGGGVVVSGNLLEDDAIRLCVSAPSGVPCEGDSGAGLVTAGSAPVLVGVLSGGPASCAPGSHSVFAYVSAGEIHRFLTGDATPPRAPRQTPATTVTLAWTPPLVAGTTIRCSSGGWANGPVRLRFSFLAGDGRVLQTGTAATYTLPVQTVASTVACRVSAMNAGGTALAQTNPTPAIGASAPLKLVGVAPDIAIRGAANDVIVVLLVPPGARGGLAVCLRPPPEVGSAACATLAHSQGAVTATFHLSLHVASQAPLGSAALALTASAGDARARFTVRVRVVAARRAG